MRVPFQRNPWPGGHCTRACVTGLTSRAPATEQGRGLERAQALSALGTRFAFRRDVLTPHEPTPAPKTAATVEPIRWFRPLIPTALGNCVADHVCMAKYKLRTGQKIGWVFDPAIDFHADLAVCNPHLDAACAVGDFRGDPNALPEPSFGRIWNYLIENTEPAGLEIPEHIAEKVLTQLGARGLSPGDRIITIHAREPGYKYYTPAHEPERFVSPEPFMRLAEYWAERGFKVVRIGDPSCTPFPSHPRIVDAAHWQGKRLIHDLVLIGLSDALVATDSGVWPIGVALGTPTLLSNSCHGQPAHGTLSHWFPWEPGHAVLNKRLLVHGEAVPAEVGVSLFEGRRWREIAGVTRLEDNTLDELIEATTRLLVRHGKETRA